MKRVKRVYNILLSYYLIIILFIVVVVSYLYFTVISGYKMWDQNEVEIWKYAIY